MFKNLMLLATITAIHYSALGNYLVNQDGQRVTIQGHPQMICYRPHGTLHGTFLKADGATIWLRVPTIPPGGDVWEVKIAKPVCDIIGKGELIMFNLALGSNALLLLAVLLLVRRDHQVTLARKQHKRLPR